MATTDLENAKLVLDQARAKNRVNDADYTKLKAELEQLPVGTTQAQITAALRNDVVRGIIPATTAQALQQTATELAQAAAAPAPSAAPKSNDIVTISMNAEDYYKGRIALLEAGLMAVPKEKAKAFYDDLKGGEYTLHHPELKKLLLMNDQDGFNTLYEALAIPERRSQFETDADNVMHGLHDEDVANHGVSTNPDHSTNNVNLDTLTGRLIGSLTDARISVPAPDPASKPPKMVTLALDVGTNATYETNRIAWLAAGLRAEPRDKAKLFYDDLKDGQNVLHHPELRKLLLMDDNDKDDKGFETLRAQLLNGDKTTFEANATNAIGVLTDEDIRTHKNPNADASTNYVNLDALTGRLAGALVNANIDVPASTFAPKPTSLASLGNTALPSALTTIPLPTVTEKPAGAPGGNGTNSAQPRQAIGPSTNSSVEYQSDEFTPPPPVVQQQQQTVVRGQPPVARPTGQPVQQQPGQPNNQKPQQPTDDPSGLHRRPPAAPLRALTESETLATQILGIDTVVSQSGRHILPTILSLGLLGSRNHEKELDDALKAAMKGKDIDPQVKVDLLNIVDRYSKAVAKGNYGDREKMEAETVKNIAELLDKSDPLTVASKEAIAKLELKSKDTQLYQGSSKAIANRIASQPGAKNVMDTNALLDTQINSGVGTFTVLMNNIPVVVPAAEVLQAKQHMPGYKPPAADVAAINVIINGGAAVTYNAPQPGQGM